MAHITHTSDQSVLPRIGHAVRGFFDSIFTALTINADYEARLRQVARLRAMTDEQLAERGIKRDRIVHHVFREIYYV